MRLQDLGGNFAGYTAITFAGGSLPTGPIWQLALEVGVWFNQNYGDVPIVADDLRSMYRNFKTGLHPQKPQQLPVDYEHLSVKQNRKPGDGIAAGWIMDVELRGDDTQLWTLIDYTDPCRTKIENKEYKGFSPFFHPNWSAHGGKGEIGPTLLGGAVTNYQTVPDCVITCSNDSTLAVRRGNARAFADVSALTFSERETRVRAAFDLKYPTPRNSDGFIDWVNSRDVRDVTEDRVIFSFQGKKWAIQYSVATDLTVTFDGDPFEVIVIYDPVVALSHEGTVMKLKDASGKEVEIPATSFAGLTLDALSEVPAVKTLRDQVPATGTRVIASTEFDALQTSIATLTTSVDSLKAENATIKTEAATNKAAADAAAAVVLSNVIDGLVREGRCLPAQKEFLVKLAAANRPLFDEEVTRMKTAAPIIRLDATFGGDGGGNVAGSSVKMFDTLVEEIKTRDKLTYAEAMKKAGRQNPDLARARNQELSLPVGKGGIALVQ